MAVTPRAAGDVLTAAIFNTKLEAPVASDELAAGAVLAVHLAAGIVGAGHLAALPRAKATKTLAQAVPSGVWTALTFPAEAYDNAGLHDLVTNPSRLTASIAGRWDARGLVAWSGVAGGAIRSARFYVNGVAGDAMGVPPSTQGNHVLVQSPLVLAAGDYVELWALQDSGANLDAGNASYLFLEWVRP